MRRILVDLPEEHLQALADMVEAQGRPRAALIREAVAAYVVTHQRQRAPDVFGLWKGKHSDGVAYQRALRKAW